MPYVSEIVTAWRAGRDLSMYRKAYSEMDLVSFMRTFRCSSRIAIRIFGRNKNRSKNPRTRCIKDRIDNGEFDFYELRKEWMRCQSEKYFCKKYLTTSHTCRDIFGDRLPSKERKMEPKESYVERYRREKAEEKAKNDAFRAENERSYSETYYEEGNCVTPVLSKNLNIL